MILGLAEAGSVAHVTAKGITRVNAKGRIVLPTIHIKGRLPKAAAKKPAGIVARTVAALTTPTAAAAAVADSPAAAPFPVPVWALIGLGLVGLVLTTDMGRQLLGGGGRRVRNPRRRYARNPGGPHTHRDPRVRRAARLREAFAWGIPARRVRSFEAAPTPAVVMDLGTLEAVTYRTHKKGERARYFVHDFEGPRPVLSMDVDNKRLHITGGGYTVTSRGIEG
jgi:hypothetical protein